MKKLLNEEVKINKKQIENILNEESSKSNKMKKLFDLGIEVKTISEYMNVRYNFVYNVISNYININEIEVVKEEKSDKKNQIIELYRTGMKKVDISKKLKTNYNYVFKVVKELEESRIEDIK